MNNFRKISEKLKNSKHYNLVRLYGFIFIIGFVLFPFSGSSLGITNEKVNTNNIYINDVLEAFAKEVSAEEEIVEQTPEPEREVAYSRRYTMTAYNSEVAQCDDSPCITANGFNVCEHGIEDTVAANFLPFGTEVRIPELFGDKILIVRDRMNSRYTERVDVWLLSHDNAIDFGVKYPMIEVLK